MSKQIYTGGAKYKTFGACVNDVMAGKYIYVLFGGTRAKPFNPSWAMSMQIRTLWKFWKNERIWKAIRRNP